MAFFYGGYKGGEDDETDTTDSNNDTESESEEVETTDSDADSEEEGGFWGGAARLTPEQSAKKKKDAEALKVKRAKVKTAADKAKAVKKKSADKLKNDKQEAKDKIKSEKEAKKKASTQKLKKPVAKKSSAKKTATKKTSAKKKGSGITKKKSTGSSSSSSSSKRSGPFEKCQTYTVTRVISPKTQFCEREGTKGGRFQSTTPSAAAKKAAYRIFAFNEKYDTRKVFKIVFEIRCLTRNSNRDRLHEYEATQAKEKKIADFKSKGSKDNITFARRKLLSVKARK